MGEPDCEGAKTSMSLLPSGRRMPYYGPAPLVWAAALGHRENVCERKRGKTPISEADMLSRRLLSNAACNNFNCLIVNLAGLTRGDWHSNSGLFRA